MISIAARLLRDISGDKPTVLMIVDRLELEGQLRQNLEQYGIRSFREARNKLELQDILGSDYRGLVVSMIHKFDDVPAGLNKRDNVVVLVDEAHRSTGGHLGNYLMGALPNATYIGFTGTPIDRTSQGKGTFKTFGMDDEQGYLDKVFHPESRLRTGRRSDCTTPWPRRTCWCDQGRRWRRQFLSLAEGAGHQRRRGAERHPRPSGRAEGT